MAADTALVCTKEPFREPNVPRKMCARSASGWLRLCMPCILQQLTMHGNVQSEDTVRPHVAGPDHFQQ